MVTIWIHCVESGDSEATDLTSLKNKTFNDESAALTTPGLSSEKAEVNLDPDAGSDPTLFTDKMVSGNSVPLKENDW